MSETGFAIIGCGVIAPYHAEAIKGVEGARLVAVSDVVEANARAMAERFDAEAYTDYREVLARDDIHAVSLCVPSGLRAEIAQACAAAGKHILSEKPLEVTTSRIDTVIKAADDAGVSLGCIFQSRFGPGSQYVRKAIDSGRFGRLVLGDAYIKWYRSQEYYSSGSWRGTRSIDGGGCLMNQGVHQIDLLLWFFGKVKSVTAQTALLAHQDIEVEDLACALLEFENGAMGVIEGSTAIWPGHPARVEVHGAEGSAILEDGELTFCKFKKERPEDAELQEKIASRKSSGGAGAADPTSNLSSEGHRRQIQDFVEALRDKRPPLVDGREARRAIELIEAIYKSAETGRRVTL